MSQEGDILGLDDMWIKLLKGIEHVYQSQELSPNAYMELYNEVYTYVRDHCTSLTVRRPVLNTGGNNRRANVQDKADIAGEELYNKLKNYLKVYLEKICEKGSDLQGEDVLRFYTTNWERYRCSSKITNGFCEFLNRPWVRRQYDSGRRDVYGVFTMAMEIWQLMFFQPLNKQVTLACLQLIKAERNNEVIDTQLIKSVIESYVELGFIENQSVTSQNNQITSPTLAIYKDYFELRFLQDTAQFYRHEAATFLAQNSVTEYLKKVAQRLDEEVHRIQSYLHSSTLVALIEQVEEVLIRDQLEVIYIEAKELLRDGKHQDLALLFKLVSRVPNATRELEIIVENYIHEMGTDAIKRVSGNALDDSKLYVETILDIHTKSVKLVQEVFSSEQGFTAALDKACGKFINNNAVTIAAGNTNKSSELLARYCDILLRKGNTIGEETNLEEKFNQIMVIFNYIEDKEAFQNSYSGLLRERLVGQLSISYDYEELMISKLEGVSVEYTSRLRRIFQDIRSNTSLTD